MKKMLIANGVFTLLLLAMLSGVTRVMAQGPSEQGESAALVAGNVRETESNDTLATADVMALGDVASGKIGAAGDVDYYRFNVPKYLPLLIDVDAKSTGSSLDAVVCLLNTAGVEKVCSDDTDTPDPLLFYDITGLRGDFYIKVTAQGGVGGGNRHTYTVSVSSPLLISAMANGSVAGIPFQAADILAHSDLNTGAQKWVMFFDASDLGLTRNLNNLAVRGWGDGTLIIGFASNQPFVDMYGGAGTATPWDFLTFVPTRYGAKTEGELRWEQQGKCCGLSAISEKLDALEGWDWSGPRGEGFRFSTVGNFFDEFDSLLRGRDEDVAGMNDWSLTRSADYTEIGPCFDGSEVPGLAAEDIIGAAMSPSRGEGYFTILGTGTIAGHYVTQKDIFAVKFPPKSPSYEWNGIVWHGPDHGWNYNIDGFDFRLW